MYDYTITKESKRLLNELNNNKIRFAHWKSNSHLLKSLAGKTDLDILVKLEDRVLFESSMKILGYKKLISQPWSTYPDVEDWIGLDLETGSFLHLHTHYALVTGIQHVKHLYLPWLDKFFDHVITDNQTGWPIPAPELESLILLVRIWAKMPPIERTKSNPTIPPYIKSELLGLLQNSNIAELKALCRELNLKVPGDFESLILEILKNQDSKDILKVSLLLYGQLKPFFRVPWALSVFKSHYYKLNLKLKKYTTKFTGPKNWGKTLQSGGKVIALIGSDGSGKSTLSTDLLNWLTYKIDTHYFYMGKNPYIRSNNKNLLSKTDILFLDNKVSKLLKRLLGNMYYIILINKKLNSLRLAKKMSFSGSVIICDRFPQKTLFGINDGPYLQQRNDGWSSKLEMNLFNKVNDVEADIVIRLQVSPEVASARKPEHDKESIRKKCELINQISFDHATVINIDSNRSYDQVLSNVKQEIWKLL